MSFLPWCYLTSEPQAANAAFLELTSWNGSEVSGEFSSTAGPAPKWRMKAHDPMFSSSPEKPGWKNSRFSCSTFISVLPPPFLLPLYIAPPPPPLNLKLSGSSLDDAEYRSKTLWTGLSGTASSSAAKDPKTWWWASTVCFPCPWSFSGGWETEGSRLN